MRQHTTKYALLISDLVGGYVAHKWAAEDRDTEKGCQSPAVQQKTTDDDDLVGLYAPWDDNQITSVASHLVYFLARWI